MGCPLTVMSPVTLNPLVLPSIWVPSNNNTHVLVLFCFRCGSSCLEGGKELLYIQL